MKINTKRLLSVLLCLAMVLAVLPLAVFAETATTIYVQPNENWLQEGARFAAYFYEGDANTWLDCTDADGDGNYEVAVPAGYSNVIFCRMNPETTENNWDNKWNQTADLTVPTDNKVVYVVDGWDNGNGQWIEVGGEPVEIEVVYYLRGEMNGWDTSTPLTNNGDGTYSVTVDLVAGTYQYKIADAGWGNAYPSGDNAVLVVDSDSAVTFVLNTNDGTVTVTGDGVAEPEDPTEAPEDPTEAPEDPTEAPEDPTTEAPEDPTTEAPEDPTEAPVVDETPDIAVVTATVPADWTNVCIWAWHSSDDSNAFEGAEWPGVAMTKDGDSYSIEIPSTIDRVIINGSSNGATLQTADLTVVAGKDVTITVTVDGDGNVNADVAYADGSAPVEPEAPVMTGEFRVVGDAEWLGSWDPANSVGLMTEVSAGVYEITFKDVPVGEYNFKITKDGTWEENWGKDGFNTDNIALNVTVAGDVTIVFKAANAAISYKTAAMDEFIPVTGDMGIAAVCAALLVASAGLVCTISKKKEF